MPSNSISIVSPVSGETVPAGTVLNVSADYDYVYFSTRYVGGLCSTGSGHSAYAGPISGSTSDSIEVGLGAHTGSFTGVELTVRIQDTSAWGSPFVAQGTVNNITIDSSPPLLLKQVNPLPVFPYYKVGKKTLSQKDRDQLWPIETGREFNAKTDRVILDREYDPSADLTLSGTITDSSLFTGSIVGVVNGRLGKTGLVGVYTLAPGDVTINTSTGDWSVTIPKKVLKKKNAPRQLILTLLDKTDEFVATISAPLKKK